MSKYYSEYQSMRRSKRHIVWIAVLFVIIAALACVIAFWLVPELKVLFDKSDAETVVVEDGEDGGEETEDTVKVLLSKPYNLAIDSTKTKLSWVSADSSVTVGYSIRIDTIQDGIGGIPTTVTLAEYNVYTNPVTVNLLEGIESIIYVKSLGDNKSHTDSGWSNALTVYKEDAEEIAYATVLASIRSILQNKVRVDVGGTNTNIAVTRIYTIDYGAHRAKVWYSYTAANTEGLACTTVFMPAVTGIIDYKDKLSQIEATINNNDITTEQMPGTADYIAALLARPELTGSLANLKSQNSAITPICSYTSLPVVSGGVATITFRGIISSEKSSIIKYYSYSYTASMAEVSGYSDADYFDALSDNDVGVTVTEQGGAAVEITELGKEMLIMYEPA